MQFKIHKEGWSYFVISLLIAIILTPFFPVLGIIFIIMSLYIYYFFRDPIRFIPVEDFIISPADGIITNISLEDAPKEVNINKKFIKISIFLSIFNVHVNRAPVNGLVKKIKYIHGKFINASLDKSSKHNERNIIVVENDNKDTLIITQIAGLIARRIVCDLKEKQMINKGDKIGIIKFGSRVDLYMPLHYKPLVVIGQNVIGGETILSNPNLINEVKEFIKK